MVVSPSIFIPTNISYTFYVTRTLVGSVVKTLSSDYESKEILCFFLSEVMDAR